MSPNTIAYDILSRSFLIIFVEYFINLLLRIINDLELSSLDKYHC